MVVSPTQNNICRYAHSVCYHTHAWHLKNRVAVDQSVWLRRHTFISSTPPTFALKIFVFYVHIHSVYGDASIVGGISSPYGSRTVRSFSSVKTLKLENRFFFSLLLGGAVGRADLDTKRQR